MKTKLHKLVLLLLSVMFVLSLSACGKKPAEQHTEHSYGEWITTKAATCTENGTETRTCSVCGKEDSRTLNATGHDYGEWECVSEPTCKAEGKDKRVCSVCGDEEERNIVPVAHLYENGTCKWCGRPESDDKTMTTGVVKANVNFGCDGASDWEIDVKNGVYVAKSDKNANLTFINWQFEGGIIEWDMTVPKDSHYAFGTVCGITFASASDKIIGGEAAEDNYYCFGRAFTGEYVGYSKQNGAFAWQDYAKLSEIDCVQGVKNHFRLQYDDVNNVIYLTYGEQSTFFVPTVKLSGKYFGLYSEAAGTIFENIVVTPERYERRSISPMNQSEWKEELVDGELTYTALSGVGAAILKDTAFTTGTIEWDMLVPNGEFAFNVMCGIIWGAESDVISIYSSQLLCSGMYPSGIFVTYSKFFDGQNVAFGWENASQIDDASLMPRNVFVHYKISFDGTNLTLSVGDKTATLQPNRKPFGQYVGLYSEVAGTVFKNVTIMSSEA